ncbi:MAG: T9SS type A sorting domain-containing protein [Bacteroidota bacterium]
MRKTLLIMGFCLLGWGSNLYAQQGNVAAGGDGSGTGGSVSYSIGQVDYINVTATAGSITQGVQQPFEIFSAGIEYNGVKLNTSVYPNPTIESLTLQVDKDLLTNLEYQLYDMHGRLLISNKVEKEETAIDMSKLAAATYFLKVLNNETLLQTYKIIKTK